MRGGHESSGGIVAVDRVTTRPLTPKPYSRRIDWTGKEGVSDDQAIHAIAIPQPLIHDPMRQAPTCHPTLRLVLLRSILARL